MSNPNKEAKKKLRNARIAFFVIPNAILGIICAILGYAKWQELKSHWPLFAISDIIILLILNRICYSLYKAREDRNLTRLDPNVGADQVESSLKLLRYAAAALAVISFITTAQGLESFVFPEEGQEWQAYTASFAVQSILLVFNFLFFPFYVRIKKPERFPAFFQQILIYCIVFLFIGSLIVSSTFSYVFIANNTYKDMRPKNSNITIEKFLTEEAYNLSRVNDEILKACRDKVVRKTTTLQKSINRQRADNNDLLESKIKDILENTNITVCDENVEFYSQTEYDADILRSPNLTAQYNIIRGSINAKKDRYISLYKNYYKPAYMFYEEFKKARIKLEYTDYDGLEDFIGPLLDKCKDNGEIDKEIESIGKIKIEGKLVEYVAHYRGRAEEAFKKLKEGMKDLYRLFERIRDEAYGENGESESDVAANEEKVTVTDIFAFVYNNEYDTTEAERILDFLSEQREGLHPQTADGADQSGSTSEPDSTSEPNNPYKDLAEFTEDFKSFVKYAELKERIKGFIDNNLSITYYIKSKGESDELAPDEQSPAPETTTPAPSREGGHTYKTVSEAEWTQERKRDFVEFISCLKALPDLEQYKEKEDASVKNEEEASALMKDYDQQAVLEEAYTLNRDLLEDISAFEQAINYFKYDFRLMAVLSAIMALFMDVASFLVGGFMFGADFFKNAKDKKRKRVIKGNIKKIGIFTRTT